MDSKDIAEKVVDKMYLNDPFSIWLGIERILVDKGICILKMKVRHEMLNGFSISHGGITYSLADSCLAFASNSHGIQSVSIETSISHLASVKDGDVLTATAEEINLTRSTGLYYVHVTNQENKKVAEFKGTVFRLSLIHI